MGLAWLKTQGFGYGLAPSQARRARVLLVVHQPHGLLLTMVFLQPFAPVLPASGAKGFDFERRHSLVNCELGVGIPAF
jgi:hypothetical protein